MYYRSRYILMRLIGTLMHLDIETKAVDADDYREWLYKVDDFVEIWIWGSYDNEDDRNI